LKFSIGTVISLLLGLIVTITIVSFMDFNKADTGIKVYVAQNPIGPGEVIIENNVKLVEWPKDYVPVGSFRNFKNLKDRVVKDKIYPNEPILEIDLAPKGSKAGLESLIEVGKRAITVRVNDVVGVAGFALPGSYVDIIANIKSDKKRVSKVVLSYVKVLAVAQATNVEANKPKVVKAVTLELSPSEAEKLDLARSIGSLSLALRNKLDATVEKSEGVSIENLMAIKKEMQNSKTKTKTSVVAAPKQAIVNQPSPVHEDTVTEIRALDSKIIKTQNE
jgi:pilus assembly protein CpaB